MSEEGTQAAPVEAMLGDEQAEQTNQEMIHEAAQEAQGKAQESVPKKYRVKVDGEELEVEEKELLKGYSHQRAASKRFQEAQAMKKQAETFISMIKESPDKFFEIAAKLGHNPRELAEKYLGSQLEEEFMDPREKEYKSAQARIRELEESIKKREEGESKQQMEMLKAKYAEEYSNQFVEALKESGLPPSKPMVAEMAKYISKAAKLGVELSPKKAVQLVMDDIKTAQRNLVKDIDGESLLKLFGPEIANKIREHDKKKIKNPEANLKGENKFEHHRKSEVKPMTPREWRRFNRGY